MRSAQLTVSKTVCSPRKTFAPAGLCLWPHNRDGEQEQDDSNRNRNWQSLSLGVELNCQVLRCSRQFLRH